MPVTRSSNRHNSQQPSNQPYSSRRAPSGSGDTKKASKPPSNEIIILSSDDDEPPPKGTLSSSKKSTIRPSRKRGATSTAQPVLSSDVVEISSEEETLSKKPLTRKQTHTSESTKDLQRTIKRLKEEHKRSEELLASTSRELEELKHNCSFKDVLSGLGEYTSCEVCANTMWCPYILPQCGHSFCESCLVDWFSTTQAQHLTANPQLDNSRAALAGHIQTFVQMVPNLHAYGPHGQLHVRTVLAELRRHRPEYTCPSCRKEVLNKPVEDFRLKDLIREIAGMTGETNSSKKPSNRGSGLFDHFFAAPILPT